MQTARKPAAPRPARAAGRYWKGKAPKGVDASALSDSDSDAAPEEAGEDQEAIDEEEFELGGRDEGDTSQVKKGVAKMSVALRDVDVRDGKVYVGGQEEEEEESEESEEEEAKPKAPGAESGSSEDESSSEEESEEEPPKPQFRPVFVPKRARETIKKMEAESEFSEEAIKKRELEAEERKKASHDLVAESIKRELAEKETAENIPDIDDADGLDPSAEFESWRTRELARLARDASAAQAREEERIERERRAALPEEERLREDQARADKTREEKPKGQQKFLQKYWHKGAFHQDADILKRHDFTEATESTIDATLLPSVMQVKNFGKRGQTKYTHLRDQDTTVKLGEFGAAGVGKAPRPAGAVGQQQEGCFNCGGPHLKRDCPNPPAQQTGANASFSSKDAPPPRTWGAGRSANAADHKGRSGQSWKDRDNEGRRDDEPRRGDTRDLRRDDDRNRDRHWRPDDRDSRRDRSPGRSRPHDDDRRRDYSPRRRDDKRGERSRHDRDTDDRRRRSRSREHRREHSPPSRDDRPPLRGGSGLAGLSAAYLLTNTRIESEGVEFEVHIFEKSEVLGMDAESLTVKVPAGSGLEKEVEVRVDVPMRSIQGGPYPRLIKFYEHLGVELKQHDYSYSFSTFATLNSKRTPVSTRMIYNGASGREGMGIPSNIYKTHLPKPLDILAVLTNFLCWVFAMLALVLHYARLYVLSRPSTRTPTHLCRETLRAWTTRTTQQNALSRLLGWEAFVSDVIVPLFSAVCTTSVDDVWMHPVAEILDYIWLTFGTHHYVAARGVQDIVSRLTSPILPENIHLGSEVSALASSTEGLATVGVNVGSKNTSDAGTRTIGGFSHIILATPTHHSARLIESFKSSLPGNSPLHAPLNKAVQKLDLFCTHKAVVIIHQDESVLPDHHRDWRDLNLVMELSNSSTSKEKPISSALLTPGCAMATHIFPTPSGPPLCQTTNPIISPLPHTIISQSSLDRSVLTVESKSARDSFCKPSQLDESKWMRGDLQGLGVSEGEKAGPKVWLCGAWAYGGIPLLEGCIGSAEIVVEGILEMEGLKAAPVF
ncbi:hypothetical protein BDV93DRAFT_537517 [Ceratobasidium sp. AG-I]|nr:hypothetical protein BDV93DRAFT_537517 [Ceratobasidium sp. AG-I]